MFSAERKRKTVSFLSHFPLTYQLIYFHIHLYSKQLRVKRKKLGHCIFCMDWQDSIVTG